VENSHNENKPNLHYLLLVLYVLKNLQYGLSYQMATVIRKGCAVFEAMLTSTTSTNNIIINTNVEKTDEW
jgi:hypothetical protein